jgi:hypothetical protein
MLTYKVVEMNSELTPPSTPRMQTRSSNGKKRAIQNPTYPSNKRAKTEGNAPEETKYTEEPPPPAIKTPVIETQAKIKSPAKKEPPAKTKTPFAEPAPATSTVNATATRKTRNAPNKNKKTAVLVEEEEEEEEPSSCSSSSWETEDEEEEEDEEEDSETLGDTEDDWDEEEEASMKNTLIKTLISLLILELRNNQLYYEDDYYEDEEDDDNEYEDEEEDEEDESAPKEEKRGRSARLRRSTPNVNTTPKTNHVAKFCEITKYKNSHECVEFFKKLEKEQQFEYLQKLDPYQKKLVHAKPLLLMVLDLPDSEENNKLVAIEKINTIARLIQESNGSTGEEISKLNGWVHQFMRIPFGKYQSIPISLESSPADQRLFLYNARQTLDQVIYGMTDAKIQIIQLIGQILVNPMAANTSIGIEGPAGTGKTTLIKDGLSRIFNRPTKFIPLGGAVEGSMLDGSPSVYIGSKCGAIVNALMTSQTMNPIFIFDELDKLPDSSKGFEVTQVLMRLTDSTQNNTFSDKYFEDVELDLGKCTCVFSYNDLSKIDPTMASRLFKIKTEGYSYKDKIVIGRDYLLPKILNQMNFGASDIRFEEVAFRQILDRQDSGEKGVRSFKHALETICSKINMSRLLNTTNDIEYNPLGQIAFPFQVTADIVKKLIPNKNFNPSHMMYM